MAQRCAAREPGEHIDGHGKNAEDENLRCDGDLIPRKDLRQDEKRKRCHEDPDCRALHQAAFPNSPSGRKASNSAMGPKMAK